MTDMCEIKHRIFDIEKSYLSKARLESENPFLQTELEKMHKVKCISQNHSCVRPQKFSHREDQINNTTKILETNHQNLRSKVIDLLKKNRSKRPTIKTF